MLERLMRLALWGLGAMALFHWFLPAEFKARLHRAVRILAVLLLAMAAVTFALHWHAM